MLELFYLHKGEFHKGGFCIFRTFIFCRKFSNYFNRYIKIVTSITNFILLSLISDSYVIQRGSISYQTDPIPTIPPPGLLPPPIPHTTHPLGPHHPLVEFCVQFWSLVHEQEQFFHACIQKG